MTKGEDPYKVIEPPLFFLSSHAKDCFYRNHNSCQNHNHVKERKQSECDQVPGSNPGTDTVALEESRGHHQTIIIVDCKLVLFSFHHKFTIVNLDIAGIEYSTVNRSICHNRIK
jgi:hypothetical protein